MVRTELGYGPDEWRALPWHHQRNFIEQLVWRGKYQAGAGGDDGDIPDDVLRASGVDFSSE